MSKVNKTQTRTPGLSLAEKNLDVSKNYIRVQVSEPGKYTSPLQKYLDAESPTRPGEPMCKIKADGRTVGDDAHFHRTLSGGEDMVLLEISKEDSDYCHKFGHPVFAANGEPTGWQDALDRERRVEADTGDQFEQIQGGVLTG